MISNPIYGKIKNGNQTTNQLSFFSFYSYHPMDPNTVREGTAEPLDIIPQPLPKKVRLDP